MIIRPAEFDRRLAAHIDAVRSAGGKTIVKSGDYYGEALEDETMRQAAVKTCQAAGIRGQFDSPMFCTRKSLRLWME